MISIYSGITYYKVNMTKKFRIYDFFTFFIYFFNSHLFLLEIKMTKNGLIRFYIFRERLLTQLFAIREKNHTSKFGLIKINNVDQMGE